MQVGLVEATGITITVDEQGYYVLDVWARTSGSLAGRHEEYRALTWHEVQDVVAESLHVRRPGWSLGDGWSQAPLF